MMLSLSQNKRNPKHDPEKSDVFAFGLMLVEIVFGEPITSIYDFEQF